MDYPCGKFGDCSFSRFGSIVRTDRRTDRHTDADERFTPATVVTALSPVSTTELTTRVNGPS